MATDIPALADEIEAVGNGWDAEDPEQLHEALTNMHRIANAVATTYRNIGDRVSETGVHPQYADALHEAANRHQSTGDDLEQTLGGGVMRGPGG